MTSSSDQEHSDAFQGETLQGFLQKVSSRPRNNPVTISVRDLISHWGAFRRGRRISEEIREDLREWKIICHPPFEELWVDAEVQLISLASSTEESDIKEAAIAPTDGGAIRVGSLKSATAGLVFVAPDSTIEIAQSRMMAGDYSQLAVMSGSRSLRGYVSWESIAKARMNNPECTLSLATVKPEAPIRPEDDLLAHVPRIIEKDFLFVEQIDGSIGGIVTTADLSEEFLLLAQPFFLIREIERRLRRVIDETFNEDDLASVVNINEGHSAGDLYSAEDLTIGQYQRLLEVPANWERLGWLGTDRKIFIEHLDSVRDIRNDVMHFSPDPVDSEHLRRLQTFIKWLRHIDPRP